MVDDLLSQILNKYKEIVLSTSIFGEKVLKNSPALTYHQNSKLYDLNRNVLRAQVQNFNNEFFHSRASQPYKIYPECEIISLNEFINKELPEVDLFKSIQNRRSIKEFCEHKITLEHIYLLLHYSYGISKINPIYGVNEGSWCYRNVPSGGALYPIELYVSVFNSELDPGLYHYRPDINALELIKKGSHYNDLKPIIEVRNACCTIFMTSIYERSMVKYGERGYRFILLEAGFISQNLSLILEAIKLASCMFGGYKDEEINSYLNIDGISETVQNVLVIGKNKLKYQ